jgi:glycosyltransferase involved in cell wall biosynthesis
VPDLQTVGHFSATRYWQKYVFNHAPEGYRYRRAVDVPVSRLGFKSRFARQTKWVLPLPFYHLYHTYNAIIPWNVPWVVEVESQIPRYGKLDESSRLFQWGIDRLRSDACRHIIFTSEATRQLNEDNFLQWGISSEKCSVVYRAVELGNYRAPSTNGPLRLLFAGNAFYRKGGLELLQAFEQLSHLDIRLHIISSFDVDWAVKPTQEDKAYVDRTIAKHDAITVESNVPHDRVIEAMQEADVFVATTHADPFNNTVLEAMSCGCAVVVSRERALDEIIGPATKYFTTDVDGATSEAIVQFIRQRVEELHSDRKGLVAQAKRGDVPIFV